jgi:thymidine kinase
VEEEQEEKDNRVEKLKLFITLLRVIMSLELILGPMFAGKTSALQTIIKRHESLGIKCAVYKPMSDTRYGNDFYIYSHDQSKVSALPVKYLTTHQAYEPYTISELIIVEEGQFFNDLYEFVLKAVEVDKKRVVVAGLDGDCFRKPFGQILSLIPLADKITKLTSLCKLCSDGTDGLFSFRKTKSKEVVEVGGSETYMPLCRKHYLMCSAEQDQIDDRPTIQVQEEFRPINYQP